MAHFRSCPNPISFLHCTNIFFIYIYCYDIIHLQTTCESQQHLTHQKMLTQTHYSDIDLKVKRPDLWQNIKECNNIMNLKVDPVQTAYTDTY